MNALESVARTQRVNIKGLVTLLIFTHQLLPPLHLLLIDNMVVLVLLFLVCMSPINTLGGYVGETTDVSVKFSYYSQYLSRRPDEILQIRYTKHAKRAAQNIIQVKKTCTSLHI